jgi:hypothetical protein
VCGSGHALPATIARPTRELEDIGGSGLDDIDDAEFTGAFVLSADHDVLA